MFSSHREPKLGGISDPGQVRQWDRPESIEFLRKRKSDEDDSAADALADALGDLPLALRKHLLTLTEQE